MRPVNKDASFTSGMSPSAIWAGSFQSRALGFSSAQQSLKDTNYTDRGLHWLCAMTLVSKACCRGQWVIQAAVKAHNNSSVYQLKSSPSPFPTLILAPQTILMVTHGKKLQSRIPRTRVTVHPTCPAQPPSPVWPEALTGPFFLTFRSIYIAKVICNTRNLNLTSSYRIILHSSPARTHSLQAA